MGLVFLFLTSGQMLRRYFMPVRLMPYRSEKRFFLLIAFLSVPSAAREVVCFGTAAAPVVQLINAARGNCTSLLVADESAFVNGNQKNQTYVFAFLDK